MSTRLLASVLALVAFATGCAASSATDDGQTSDGAMTSYSAERSPIYTGHYVSGDGKTLLFITDVGNKQHAQLTADGSNLDVDVDVGTILGGVDLYYIEGVTHCDDELIYNDKRSITISGNCTDSTDLFLDNDPMLGVHNTAKGVAINVTSANAYMVYADVGTMKDVNLKWTSGAEARATVAGCGNVAVVFADTTHAEAYWVDGQPSGTTCPTLPSYPAK